MVLVAALLALLTVFLVGRVAPAHAQTTTWVPPPPRAEIVVDAGSGQILAGSHIHDAVHPASTAKIFTALTAVERFAPDAKISACPNTLSIESESLWMPPTSVWPMNEMLAAMMMNSANDAAYAIACTAGGLDKFAADMNALARRLGARDTKLNDPAGLDDNTSFDGGPLTSAYDMAIATRNALQVPAIAHWASTVDYQINEDRAYALHNHNRMLPGGAYGYDGAMGFKTGHTNRALHCMVATATRNGRTLIAVVLGSETPGGYDDARRMLDAGFAMPPNARGMGQTLPPTAFSPYAQRADERAGLAQLAGIAQTSPAGNTPTVTAVAPEIKLSVTPRAAAPIVTAPKHSSAGSLFSFRYLLIALLLAAFVIVALRRRAVRRQRARRSAQRRQRAAAMRSGGLPVVDGRYRPGTRLGPPIESHVRVHPATSSITALDADLDRLEA
jgi:D-alanyl-D-alanine carboxypeptidase (penicillin-binding protein 5/6)